MVANAVRFLGAAALAAAVLASAGCGSGTEKSAKKYIAALQEYDMETLRRMIAPDVIITSGRSGTKGSEELLAAADFQAGIGTTYECTKMVIHGDTADVDLVEKSDLGTILGIPQTHHYERLVFVDGKLTLREMRRPTDEQQVFGERIRRLKSWIRMNHPDAARQIDGPQDSFKGSRALGELLVKMAREWRESGSVE